MKQPFRAGVNCIGLIAICCVPSAMRAQSEVSSMPEMNTRPQAPLSSSLTLTVGGKSTTFSVADLQAMPQKTVKVHNAHNNADESYTGVTLGDLLAKAGFAASKETQRTMLRSYLQAAGTDKYFVLYSVTEIEPSEHTGDVIIAISMNDGKPLGADGNFKLVSTEDKKPQRWVRNLAAITMKSAE